MSKLKDRLEVGSEGTMKFKYVGLGIKLEK